MSPEQHAQLVADTLTPEDLIRTGGSTAAYDAAALVATRLAVKYAPDVAKFLSTGVRVNPLTAAAAGMLPASVGSDDWDPSLQSGPLFDRHGNPNFEIAPQLPNSHSNPNNGPIVNDPYTHPEAVVVGPFGTVTPYDSPSSEPYIRPMEDPLPTRTDGIPLDQPQMPNVMMSENSNDQLTGLRWNNGKLNPISRSNPYGTNNEDWRGLDRTLNDALDRAFSQTGYGKDEFQVTAWGKNDYGKSFPVQWTGPRGAEVNIDFAHYGVDRHGRWITGPDAPHVGWQVGTSSKQVGHILLDEVPYGRD